MSYSLVQSQIANSGTSSGVSSQVVTTTATGSGNVLVAGITCQNGTGPATITAPGGWLQVGSTVTISNTTVALFYLPNSTSGVTSFTFNASVSSRMAIVFEEWSGVTLSSPLDQPASNSSTITTTTVTTGTTAALAASGELAIWFCGSNVATAETYSSILNSYVLDTSTNTTNAAGNKAQGAMFYNTSVGSAATSSGVTLGTASAYGAILAVFKPAVTNPVLATSPASLSFSATQGGANPASQNDTLNETAGIGTAWTSAITYGSGSGWLGISPSSGTLAGSGNQVVAFTCTTGALASGTYTATVTYTATTGGATATVSVTFVVAPKPVLATSPTSLSFSATVGGANPASQNSTLSETAGTATAWTSAISYGSGSGWLSISPTSGSLSASGNQVVAFTCTTGSLTAGTYTATVTYTATTGGATATVTVTFVVNIASLGTWTWDTANNQLIGSGGVNAALQYNGFSRKDGFVETDLNWSDGGGPFVRMVDTNHLYYLVINDASTSSSPNTLKLFKDVGGVFTQLGTTQIINFARGTYRHIKLDVQGTALTVYFDGVQILNVTDASITSAGKFGLLCGVKIQALSLRVQPYGDTVTSAQTLYTRQRLASTNPQATPQITNVVLAVRDPEIGSGALIPNTNYAYIKSVAQSYDDLAAQSTSPHPYMMWIDDTLHLHFKHNAAQPAPFYLATANRNILWAGNPPVVSRPDMNYRNHQIVDGGMDTTALPPITRKGDSFTQTWLMPGNLAQAPVITLDGQPQIIGVQGTDTGKDFYWQLGSNAISQDPSEIPPGSNDTIIFSNIAIQTQVRVIQDNVNATGAYVGTIGQTQLAALMNSTGVTDTGIVEDYLSVPGLNKAAATALNTSLLQQYGRLGRDIPLSTNQWGLTPGMLVGITIPQNGVINAFPLITKVTITAQPTSDASNPNVVGGLLYRFDLETSEGPNLGDWSSLFSRLIAASAGAMR